MATIICIETSTKVCSVALSIGGSLQALREIGDEYVHAEKLLPFISELISEAGISKSDINAIAVSSGPGSYTGLRIGVSAAKGLCYALDIPLISISSLESLAQQAKDDLAKVDNPVHPILFCPMIDARRMEVYMALYDVNLKRINEVASIVLNPNSLSDYLAGHTIYFTGDGAEKSKVIFSPQKNANYTLIANASAGPMCTIAERKYVSNQFENLALFEPFYLKEYKAALSTSNTKN
ncbi:MAG TPA: tRNA (adenosine(37)-N6)-threonylcarbamoyltransferase complex dimerization subunit type 1 TsaB [Bacteroidia bacterium]|nr:tRNA (adenosine(37)-N6)-threonylcarbamoyltransferase complex dimerization subunit type 1 TsaB [Bacteroidia bacterium]